MHDEEASPERISPSHPVSTNATNPGELAPITPAQVSGFGTSPVVQHRRVLDTTGNIIMEGSDILRV